MEIMEKIFGANGLYTRFKVVRNLFIYTYENAFFLASSLLALFSIITLIIGLDMTGGHIYSQVDVGLETVIDLAVAFVVIQFLLLLVMSACGVKIALDRTVPNYCVAAFASSLFFFVTVPFLSEGGAFLAVNSFDPEKINGLCKYNHEEMQSQISSPMMREIMLMAKRYDILTQQKINEKMCTDICPCLIDPQPVKYYDWELRTNEIYSHISELKMNLYFRTHLREDDPNRKPWLIPLLWTKDPKKGFMSFQECHKDWEKKAAKDPSINVKKIFDFDYARYQKWTTLKGQKVYEEMSAYQQHQIQDQMMAHEKIESLVQLEEEEPQTFGFLEKEYNCSGMCHPSLFYMSQPLSQGPPKQACLLKFVKHVNKDALPLGIFCLIVGIMCQILFLIHIGMYQRPLPDSAEDENFLNQFANYFGMAKLNPDRQRLPPRTSVLYQSHGGSAHLSQRVPHKSFDQSLDADHRQQNQIEVSNIQVKIQRDPNDKIDAEQLQ